MSIIYLHADDRRRRKAETLAALDGLRDAIAWAYGGGALARRGHERTEPALVEAFTRPGLALPAGVVNAFADPIVQAVMAADGIDRSDAEELMREAAEKLAAR
jgi:hypothetical protein